MRNRVHRSGDVLSPFGSSLLAAIILAAACAIGMALAVLELALSGPVAS